MSPSIGGIPERVSDATQSLITYIEQSGLQLGEQLPTERTLTTLLDVGRSTVRELIGKWQALGIVEVHHGVGTFLRQMPTRDMIHMPVTISSNRDSRIHVLEVRRALEIEASALAAVRATPQDLQNIYKKLVIMEEVHLRDGHAGPEDLAFHMAIYDAAKNPLFGQFLLQIDVGMQDILRISDNAPSFAARTFPYHRKLYNAIAEHDPDQARRHTRTILTLVEEEIRALPE